MPQFQFDIDDSILTSGDHPEDEPVIGDVRHITHYDTGIVLASYEVTDVWPPVVDGALWRIRGRVVYVYDSHSKAETAQGKTQPDEQGAFGGGNA